MMLFRDMLALLDKRLSVETEEDMRSALQKNGAVITARMNPEVYWVVDSFDHHDIREAIKLGLKHRTPVKIIGVEVVRACVQRRMEIPAERMPLLSLALENINACIIGAEKRAAKDLALKLKFLGATVSDRFENGKTTHLIVGSTGPGLDVAERLVLEADTDHVEIVSTKWASESWVRIRVGRPFAGKRTAPAPEAEFRLPPFWGLRISLSGIQPVSERHRMAEMIRNNGGAFEKDLVTRVTHLVVEESNLDTSSASKYAAARAWNLSVVRKDWVFECEQKHRRIPEQDYIVDRPYEAPSSQVMSATSSANNNNGATPAEHYADHAAPAAITTHHVEPAPIPSQTDFFKNRVIMLVGFHDSDATDLTQAIWDAAGKTRTSPSEAVTHYVVNDPTDERATREVRPFVKRAFVISPRWLRDCLTQRSCVSAESYRIELPRSKRERPTDSDPMLVESVSKRAKTLEAPSSQVSSDRSEEADAGTLFKGKVIYFPPIQERDPDYERAQLLVKGEGATIVQQMPNKNTVSSKCDFVVLPHGHPNAATISLMLPLGAQVVSPNFIINCASARQIIDPNFVAGFRPLATRADQLSKILTGCEVTTSQYNGWQRDALKMMSLLMGANFIPGFKVKSTTHVVCMEPTGEKFKAATEKARFPVKKSWLEACALGGYRAEESQHSFFAGSQYTPPQLAPPAPTRAFDVAHNEVPKSAPKAPGMDEFAFLNDMDPNELFGPPNGEPGADAMDVDQGHTVEQRPRVYPPPIQLLPAFDAEDDMGFSSSHFDVPPSLGIPPTGKQIALVHPNEPVLFGVRLFISSKVKDAETVRAAAKELGAEFAWEVDNNVTHVIWEGKLDGSRELKTAKALHLPLVSPHWLIDCRKQMKKLSYNIYPPQVDPTSSLSMAKDSVSPNVKTLKTAPTTVERDRLSIGGSMMPPPMPVTPRGKVPPATKFLDEDEDPASSLSFSQPHVEQIVHNARTLPPAAPPESPPPAPVLSPVPAPPRPAQLVSPAIGSSHPTSDNDAVNTSVDVSQSRQTTTAAPPSQSAPVSAVVQAPVAQSQQQPKKQASPKKFVIPHEEQKREEIHTAMGSLLQILQQKAPQPVVEADDVMFQPAPTLNRPKYELVASSSGSIVDSKPRKSMPGQPAAGFASQSARLLDSTVVPSNSGIKSLVEGPDPLQDDGMVEPSSQYTQTHREDGQTGSMGNEGSASQTDANLPRIHYLRSEESTTTLKKSTKFAAKNRDVRNLEEELGRPRAEQVAEPPDAPAAPASPGAIASKQKEYGSSGFYSNAELAPSVPGTVRGQASADMSLQVPKRVMSTPSQVAPAPAGASNRPKSPTALRPVKETQQTTSPRRKLQPQEYVIGISGYNEPVERDRMIRLIQQLGGNYSTKLGKDLTHLIAKDTPRSPKIITSLAYGRWILKASWLSESIHANRFVPEEPHEWDASSAIETNKPTAAACRSCRRRRAAFGPNDKRSLFRDVMVSCFFKDKEPTNTNMLHESGMTVLPNSFDPQALIEAGCQFFFTDRLAIKDPRMRRLLEQRELPVVTTLWISDFLLQNSNEWPDPRLFHPNLPPQM